MKELTVRITVRNLKKQTDYAFSLPLSTYQYINRLYELREKGDINPIIYRLQDPGIKDLERELLYFLLDEGVRIGTLQLIELGIVIYQDPTRAITTEWNNLYK